MTAKGKLRTVLIAAAAAVLSAFPAYAAAGWINAGGTWHYELEDGTTAVNRVTPDGYYVDGDGVWKKQTLTILSQKITSPSRFVPLSEISFPASKDMLNLFNRTIQGAANGKRIFHLYQDGITYGSLSTSNSTQSEELLLSLTGDPAVNGYKLRISGNLGDGTFNAQDIHSYDYAVFRYLCALISNRPDILADAIYQSWQGNNGYGIRMDRTAAAGDAMISLDIENGAGVYHISALPAP